MSDSNDSDSNKSQHQIQVLEANELARCRLHYLKKSFKQYNSLYEGYLHQHYLFVTLSGVVVLFGFIIIFLKFEGQQSLLYSFKFIQSGFASVVSGGGIIGFGSTILFSKNGASDGSTKDEFKDEAIRLCVERDLGEKIDKTTKKLREKKYALQTAKSWQAIWSIYASIIVLILVGIDFFGFLPDIEYIDIGLDLLLSLGGMYFFGCVCMLYILLSTPRDKLEKNRFILYVFVVPCAFWDGLISTDGDHWVKEVYLSQDERAEIMYLLRGVNPEISHLRIERFYNELKSNLPSEKTPLMNDKQDKHKTDFVNSIDQIESKARQEVLIKYFELGEELSKWLNNDDSDKPDNPDNTDNSGIAGIINKFRRSIKSDKKEIKKYYLDFQRFHRGITLPEFFEKNTRPKELIDKEIKTAHNALKVYSVFNGIKQIDPVGSDKLINRIKTFSASSIGEFTRNEIFNIIDNYTKDFERTNRPNKH